MDTVTTLKEHLKKPMWYELVIAAHCKLVGIPFDEDNDMISVFGYYNTGITFGIQNCFDGQIHPNSMTVAQFEEAAGHVTDAMVEYVYERIYHV